MKEPKFVISKSIAIEKYNIVKKHSDIVTYSSKTNQDVTKILEESTDTMFSVHFKNELKHLKDLSRAIFLAQGWKAEFIKELTDKGVTHFIVDNESDLEIFISFIEKTPLKLTLFLRMKLRENSIRTEKYFVFGMNSNVINKRIKELSSFSNLKLGLHFHRKTQNMSEWNLVYELSNMIEEKVFEKITYVNIGGGLPSEYANTNINVLDSIFKKIDELKIWLNEKDVKLILEPGRFIAAPSTKLVTNIIGIYENNIIVDASVYNSDMDAIVVPVKLLVEGELPKGEGYAYAIKGVTPCSLDLFRYKVYLKDPKVGDKIVFLNAGAYNFSSDFCDLEKISVEITK